MSEDEQVSTGESETVAASVGGPTPADAASPTTASADSAETLVDAAAGGAEAQPASDESQPAPDEPRPDDEAPRPDRDAPQPEDESRPAESHPAAELSQSAADESQPGSESSELAAEDKQSAEEPEQQGDEPSEQVPAADEPAATAWRSYALKGERRHPEDCTVIFARSALNKIVEHLSHDVSREHGGLLLGHVAESPFTDELAVWVMDALPAKHTKGSRSRLTFTQETWADFDDVTEHLRNRGLEYKRVGWYHSHPSFGVFLSSYDLNVCEDFRLPTHVALVYDPINHEGGFFVRGETGYDPRGPQGFREFPNTRPAPAPVDWRNIQGVKADIPATPADSAAESAPASAVLQIGRNVSGKSEESVEPLPVAAEEQTIRPLFFTPESTPPPVYRGSGQKAKSDGGFWNSLADGIVNFIRRSTKEQVQGTGEAPPVKHIDPSSAGAPSEVATVQAAEAEAPEAVTTGELAAGDSPPEEGAATPTSRDDGPAGA